MSAVIEADSRYPGLPLPPPSEAAKAWADAILSAYVDRETMTVRTIRRLMVDTYDHAISVARHEAEIAAIRAGGVTP